MRYVIAGTLTGILFGVLDRVLMVAVFLLLHRSLPDDERPSICPSLDCARC